MLEAAAILGVLVYLCSYALLQTGMVRGDSYRFAAMVSAGAALMLVSLAGDFNLASFLVQIGVILISAIGVLRVFLINRSISFSPEEKELLSEALPLTPQSLARKFFDAGRWEFIPEGTVVIREGEPHGQLLFVSQGQARITRSGAVVGHVEAGAFLGEMTVLYGTPATATATITEPARVFRITAEALKILTETSAQFRLTLEGSLAKDTARKLVAANEALADATNVKDMPKRSGPGPDAA